MDISTSSILWTDMYARDIEDILNGNPDLFISMATALNESMRRTARDQGLRFRANLSSSIVRPNEWIVEYEIYDTLQRETYNLHFSFHSTQGPNPSHLKWDIPGKHPPMIQVKIDTYRTDHGDTVSQLNAVDRDIDYSIDSLFHVRSYEFKDHMAYIIRIIINQFTDLLQSMYMLKPRLYTHDQVLERAQSTHDTSARVNIPPGDKYYQKYLKYKQKYLKLKNIGQ